MKITEQKIKEKLREFLKREPTDDEVKNSFKDQNIVNSIILDILDEEDKQIIFIQEELTKLKK